jgi:hypothetical protein
MLCRLLLATTAALAFSCYAEAAPVLSNLTPIPLHSGVNMIPGFAPDGATGLIVLGWHNGGPGDSFDVVTVLSQARAGGAWDMVGIAMPGTDPNDVPSDEIGDDPDKGRDMVRAFRFARGTVDGHPATLLLMASRDVGDTVDAPSPVTFDAYKLVHDGSTGNTPEHFVQILEDHSTGNFCNADTALSRRFGLPPRGSAPTTTDGC